jgi:hypothetical protein
MAGLLAWQQAIANDKSASQSSQKLEELLKQHQINAQPGEGHKALETLVGNWTAEIRCWMEPGGEPMVSKGKARTTWILNRRFVLQDFHGELAGESFQGLGITGYDNARKQYQSVWLDDMNTFMFISQGDSQDASKVFTFSGKMDCPQTGEKDKLMKQVIRVINPDKYVFELHDPSLGRNSKKLEITYSRVK